MHLSIKIIAPLLGITLLLSSVALKAQKNRDFYLVNDLSLDKISPADKAVLDSVLPLIHASKSDSVKMMHLSNIIEFTSGLDVWPKYNDLILKISSSSELPVYKRFRVSAFNNVAFVNNCYGKHKEALQAYASSLKLATELKDTFNCAIIYCGIAKIHLNRGQTLEAIKNLELSREASEASRSKKELASACYWLGIAYDLAGNKPKAIHYLQKFLTLEVLKNNGEKAIQLNTMGVAYERLNDTVLALDYYRKSLEAALSFEDDPTAAGACNNIATLLEAQGKIKEAIDMYTRAVKYSEQNNYLDGVPVIYNNIGTIYRRMKDYKTALMYYEKAKETAQNIGEKAPLHNSLLQIGFVYLEKGELNLCEPVALSSLKIARELGYPNQILLSAELLYDLSKKQGNDKRALTMFELRSEMKDSLNNENNRKAIYRLNIKNEFEKKESVLKLEAEKSEAEKKNLELELLNQRYNTRFQRLLFLLAFLLMAAAVAIFIVRVKNKRLREKNRISELENSALRLHMNPHFIFNAINTIQGFYAGSDVTKAKKFIHSFSHLLRMILDSSKEKYIPLSKETEMIRCYLDLTQLRYENKFEYFIETDPALVLDNISIPPMLVQPFVENAVLHGIAALEGHGKIIVRYTRKGNLLKCEIEDNGIGREASYKINMNRIHRSSGTSISEERIKIMTDSVKLQSSFEICDLKDDSGKASGTLVKFLIPLIELV